MTMRDTMDRRVATMAVVAFCVLVAGYIILTLESRPSQEHAPMQYAGAGVSADAEHASAVVGASDQVISTVGRQDPNGLGTATFVVASDEDLEGEGCIVAVAPVFGRAIKASELFKVGDVGREGRLELAAAAWSDLLAKCGSDAGFVAAYSGAAYPFSRVAERHYLCRITALSEVAFVTKDRAGNPIPGVRIALSQSAVPKECVGEGYNGSLALVSQGKHSVHTAVSDGAGRAVFRLPGPGKYCVDVGCMGWVVVAGLDPQSDYVTAPSASDVAITLDPLMVASADLLADDVCWLQMTTPSAKVGRRQISSRELLRNANDYRKAFPSADVVDTVVMPDAVVGGRSSAHVVALVRVGEKFGRIAADVPLARMALMSPPTQARVDTGHLVSGGVVVLDVVDATGIRCADAKYALIPQEGPLLGWGDSTPFITVQSGAPCLVPVGVYDVEFADALVRSLCRKLTVSVKAGSTTTVTAQLDAAVARFVVKLESSIGDESVGGVALRIQREGVPAVSLGGDGGLEFGPFWARRSRVAVETWASGFARNMTEFDLANVALGDVHIMRISLLVE